MTSATVAVELARQHRRGRLFVALAAIAWSTAGLFQRELSVGIGTQLAGRALFAVLGLLAYVAIAERGAVGRAFRAIGRDGLAAAALMAVSSGSFIAALNYTSVANVLFMQALSPILAAVLGSLLGESVSRRTWLAMAIALAGVALMVGGPSRPSPLGLSLSLLMSVSFAGTIVITRRRRDVSMAPATCLSQLAVLVAGAPFAAPNQVGARDLLLLVALGVGQIGLGLVFLTIGARLIPAAEVALITLLEIVLGPLWVWIFLSEQPGAATIAGGLIVLGAVAIQARATVPVPIPAEPALPPPP
jgi:drug/metabolite transporter (DMT)-like permease